MPLPLMRTFASAYRLQRVSGRASVIFHASADSGLRTTGRHRRPRKKHLLILALPIGTTLSPAMHRWTAAAESRSRRKLQHRQRRSIFSSARRAFPSGGLQLAPRSRRAGSGGADRARPALPRERDGLAQHGDRLVAASQPGRASARGRSGSTARGAISSSPRRKRRSASAGSPIAPLRMPMLTCRYP